MKIIKIFLLSGLILAGVSAQDHINAMKVPGNVAKIGPESKAWFSAEYIDITLYPQGINKFVEGEKSKKARVKALHDGNSISFLIEWKDTTKNTKKDRCSKVQVDGFALQIPLNYSDVSKLPYISMGNKDRPVVVHLRKADEEDYRVNGFQELDEYYDTFHNPIKKNSKKDKSHIFITEGFNSVIKKQYDADSGVMDMVYKDGFWKGTLSRPLKAEYFDLSNGSFPVSIVTWDGNLTNSNKIEYLSSWIGVKFFGERDGEELLDSLESQIAGDIYNGEKLAIENCAACHNFADTTMAPAYMAPNLSNIGGYSTEQYLLESIIEPSAVIVPNHKSNEQTDFPWYNLDEDGNFVSTMPSYEWMDEDSINDLVTYFKTLKAPIE